jgi:catechol 2,3-dioxygenase-like lactoylglutathione lyase family enzyme
MTDSGNLRIPVAGVHHITLIGSNRQDTIDFYSGVLGMPLVLEQPNLDVPEETHLYFDAGDGRLITFFVREDRATDSTPAPEAVGAVHHIAYNMSRVGFDRAVEGLAAANYPSTGAVDRGFMDSVYFRDPNGHLIELATYKFETPEGRTATDVLAEAHRVRTERGASAIDDQHVSEAVNRLSRSSAGV